MNFYTALKSLVTLFIMMTMHGCIRKEVTSKNSKEFLLSCKNKSIKKEIKNSTVLSLDLLEDPCVLVRNQDGTTDYVYLYYKVMNNLVLSKSKLIEHAAMRVTFDKEGNYQKFSSNYNLRNLKKIASKI